MTTEEDYKTIADIRRKNLADYIEESWDGKVIDFSAAVGRSRQQIYKMLSDPRVNKVHRPMGSLLARGLEQQLNLSHGYFDQDHDAIRSSDILREIEGLSLEQQRAVTSLIRSMS